MRKRRDFLFFSQISTLYIYIYVLFSHQIFNKGKVRGWGQVKLADPTTRETRTSIYNLIVAASTRLIILLIVQIYMSLDVYPFHASWNNREICRRRGSSPVRPELNPHTGATVRSLEFNPNRRYIDSTASARWRNRCAVSVAYLRSGR